MRDYLRLLAIACCSASSVLCLAACESPPRLTVARIIIDAPRGFDSPPDLRTTLRAALEARLRADNSISYTTNGDKEGYLVRLQIADVLIEDEDGARGVQRMLQVSLQPVGQEPAYTTSTVLQSSDMFPATLAGFDEAWRAIYQQRRLDHGKERELVAALANADPHLRDFAITRLAERKNRDAVMPLCARLEQETKPELVLRIIGALVAIGDARAIEPIIAQAQHRDVEFVTQVVFAVGAIGGRTAEGYLVTVASGHPVESVRRSAEQALTELTRRRR